MPHRAAPIATPPIPQSQFSGALDKTNQAIAGFGQTLTEVGQFLNDIEVKKQRLANQSEIFQRTTEGQEEISKIQQGLSEAPNAHTHVDNFTSRFEKKQKEIVDGSSNDSVKQGVSQNLDRLFIKGLNKVTKQQNLMLIAQSNAEMDTKANDIEQDAAKAFDRIEMSDGFVVTTENPAQEIEDDMREFAELLVSKQSQGLLTEDDMNKRFLKVQNDVYKTRALAEIQETPGMFIENSKLGKFVIGMISGDDLDIANRVSAQTLRELTTAARTVRTQQRTEAARIQKKIDDDHKDVQRDEEDRLMRAAANNQLSARDLDALLNKGNPFIDAAFAIKLKGISASAGGGSNSQTEQAVRATMLQFHLGPRTVERAKVARGLLNAIFLQAGTSKSMDAAGKELQIAQQSALTLEARTRENVVGNLSKEYLRRTSNMQSRRRGKERKAELDLGLAALVRGLNLALDSGEPPRDVLEAVIKRIQGDGEQSFQQRTKKEIARDNQLDSGGN